MSSGCRAAPGTVAFFGDMSKVDVLSKVCGSEFTGGGRQMLVTCSQMLEIKNKTTQLLMVKDLRPSKHYFLLDIMIFRRRS